MFGRLHLHNGVKFVDSVNVNGIHASSVLLQRCRGFVGQANTKCGKVNTENLLGQGQVRGQGQGQGRGEGRW